MQRGSNPKIIQGTVKIKSMRNLFLSKLKAILLIIALGSILISFSSCGATAYGPDSYRGGYSEMQLASNTYRVYFGSNAYTSKERNAKFLMRRCAELTLELGKRYFVRTTSKEDATVGSGYRGAIMTWPAGEAIIKVLDDETEPENSFDSMLIIKQTHNIAGGKLSPKALQQYRIFKKAEKELVEPKEG